MGCEHPLTYAADMGVVPCLRLVILGRVGVRPLLPRPYQNRAVFAFMFFWLTFYTYA